MLLFFKKLFFSGIKRPVRKKGGGGFFGDVVTFLHLNICVRYDLRLDPSLAMGLRRQRCVATVVQHHDQPFLLSAFLLASFSIEIYDVRIWRRQMELSLPRAGAGTTVANLNFVREQKCHVLLKGLTQENKLSKKISIEHVTVSLKNIVEFLNVELRSNCPDSHFPLLHPPKKTCLCSCVLMSLEGAGSW